MLCYGKQFVHCKHVECLDSFCDKNLLIAIRAACLFVTRAYQLFDFVAVYDNHVRRVTWLIEKSIMTLC